MATPGDISKYYKWNERTKIYDLQYWRHSVKPFTIYLKGQKGDVTIPATPDQARFDFQPTYSANQGLDDGYGQPLLAHQLTFSDTTVGNDLADFDVIFQQVNHSRNLMDKPLHIRNLAGSGRQPFILREPLLMRSNSSLISLMSKLGGGSTTARVNFRPAAYFPYSNSLAFSPGDKERLESIIGKWFVRANYIYPFWATTNETVVQLSAGGGGEFFYKQPEDSVFEAYGITSVHTDIGYKYSIDIPQISQSLSNGFVAAAAGTGTPNFPYLFPTSHMIYPGYKLRIRLEDTSGNSNDIRFVIFGRKINAPPSKIFQAIKDLDIPGQYGYKPILNSKMIYDQVPMVEPNIQGREVNYPEEAR